MSDEQEKFEGFPDIEGNFTQVPNIAFKIMHQLSGAEYKCLMYIIRHTYGFDEPIKAITLDEFQNGRKRRNGTRMDNGTGLSKQSVVTSLQSLLENGYLIVEIDDSDKARKERAYGVNRMSKNLTSDVKFLDIGSLKTGHRTEKYTVERNLEKQLPVDANASTDSLSSTDDYDAWAEGIKNTPVPAPRPRRKLTFQDNPDIDRLREQNGTVIVETPEPTDFDLLVKAVELTLKQFGATAAIYAKMLSGVATRKGFNEYRMDEPVSATELQDWAQWYERNNPRLNKPTTPMKLQSSILEYRAAKTSEPVRAAPIIPDDETLRRQADERAAQYQRNGAGF